MSKKKSQQQINHIRIIAGHWRGRKITFTNAPGLRPTGERIRETLFNWLAPYIETSHCLDLFAGSGSLGLEALSRNALSVSFVDNNPKAINEIHHNLQVLEANNATTIHKNAFDYLSESSDENSNSNFNIIFVDPPYAQFHLSEISKQLEKLLHKQKQTWIFYEHDKPLKANSLPCNWHIEKEKKAGNVFYYLIKRFKAIET